MNENQKLREVLQHAIEDLSSATGFLTRRSRDRQSKTVAALAQLQADIALPTADHIPDAGRMVNGLTKAETDASASVSGLTVATVGERESFEREMRCEEEWGHRSLKKRQNGKYENWQVDLMWAVWQARAALSAGDAVDAQRLDFIEKSARCDPKMDGQHVWWPTSLNKAIKGPTLRAAIDAAMAARAKGGAA